MRTFNYDLILEDLKTVDDLHYFASQIDMLIVSVFQANREASLKQVLETKLQRNVGNLLEQMMTAQNVSFEDHEALQDFFNGIKTYLTHLPVLQLTLAYHPSNEQVDAISTWIRQKTGKPALVNIHYDMQILGGAIITYGGKYADLTLKKRMDTVYEAKKPEILSMLGNPSPTPQPAGPDQSVAPVTHTTQQVIHNS